MDNLESKYKFYLSELWKVTDKDGFIYSDECDSLLFSCLLGAIPEVDVNIMSALDKKTGMWHRRPCSKPCYPEHSKSTISRDMLLGLCIYAYCKNRLDILEQVISYALAHYLVMGKGLLSRTIMTPGLLSTYAWASHRLGGPSRPWLRYLPQIESSKVEDYQAHLSVLHIIFRNHLTGKSKYRELLKKHADRVPDNAFYQYAAGRVDKAYTILNNEQYFPSNRLPTKADRKAEYLWQREMKDYAPTDSDHILAPADYLFVYALIEKKILG